MNGLEEPSLAKRLRGTPERIELENYRLSLQREEELEEVPEETLAEHNLSSVLDKGTEEDVPSRSAHIAQQVFLHPSQLALPAFPFSLTIYHVALSKAFEAHRLFILWFLFSVAHYYHKTPLAL